LLYVDDILIVGKNVSMIARLKKELSKSLPWKTWFQQSVFSAWELRETENTTSCTCLKRNTFRKYFASSKWTKQGKSVVH
jgi:hypothetical protein